MRIHTTCLLLAALTPSSALAAPSLPAPSATAPSGAAPAVVYSAHGEQAVTFGALHQRRATPPARGVLPLPTAGPDLRVYGYLAYWNDDLASVPWDDLTDIAIFSAGVTSGGVLTETDRWDQADDAVILAQPYGVRVHLCVTNFDSASLDALLSSSSARNTLIDALVDWQAQTGAHGVNIDFENLPFSVKSEMVDFTTDLQAAVGEVVLAAPSVDWAGSWDYDQLGAVADLFLMGYGYHWGGSSYAGPTDPLYAGAGTVWSGVQSYSLTATVADYTDPSYGADPGSVILGLPLYGMGWPTASNSVPVTTQGAGSTWVFESAWDQAAASGRSWEADSLTPYTYAGGDQIWYGDEESVRERISWVRDQTSIAGVGFWALHYDGDDAGFWSMIHDETTFGPGTTTSPTEPDPTGTDPTAAGTDTTGTDGTTGSTDPDPTGGSGWVADAGLPFLAYVGDIIVLNGTRSRGPGGAPVTYRWTQLSGPAVELSGADEAEPSFLVEHPGTHVFELLAGDGTTWSAPARSYVVVIDPALPERHEAGCGGCAAPGGGAAPGGLAVVAGVALAAARRRRVYCGGTGWE